MFSIATVTHAEREVDSHYTCTVKEWYTAIFSPAEVKDYVKLQNNIKNDEIEKLQITVRGENATIIIHRKSMPDTKDETKYSKMKNGFRGWETTYAGIENDKHRTTWLFKSAKSKEWRYFGYNIFNNKDLDAGLMIFDCK